MAEILRVPVSLITRVKSFPLRPTH